MASGSFEFTASGYLQGKIEWSSSSNGSSANTSSVTAKLYARRTNSYTTSGQSWSGYIKIGSTQTNISFSSSVSVSSSWVEMATVTTTVSHNNDGTGSVTISGSVTGPSGTALSGNTSSGSQTVTLDTIPRASSFSTSGNTIGSAVTVNISRASSSFTHTVTLKFGSVTETKTGVGTSTSFTPDLNNYGQQIPSSMSGVGTITVDTYNGSTKIGSSSSNITLNLPSTAVPTVPAISLAEAVSGLASKFGAYIQHKSKIKVTSSASGIYGSSISSYKIEINGSTYSSSSCTTNVLNNSGTNTCKVTVTDSRGKTNSNSVTFSVLAYQEPQITKFTAERNSTTSTTLNCILSASITNLNSKNDHYFTLKLNDTSKYTNTSDYSISNVSQDIEGVEETSSYTATLTVKDYFTEVSRTINIGTGFAMMNFSADGKHMAIGKIYDDSEGGVLQINGTLMLNSQEVLDYEIVDEW